MKDRNPFLKFLVTARAQRLWVFCLARAFPDVPLIDLRTSTSSCSAIAGKLGKRGLIRLPYRIRSFATLATRILSHQTTVMIGRALVLITILIAALYPFHAPINQVHFLSDKNGLLLADHGSILSSADFKATSLQNGPCSIEMWVQPSEAFASSDIVAFSTKSEPVHFEVGQRGSDLFVIREVPGERSHRKVAHIAVDDVFRNSNTLFITITSGPQGTSVYLDGIKAKAFPEFSFTAADLTGRLVIGNSPVDNRSWSGYLWGLGIFDSELTTAQVSQHYAAWMKSKGSGLSGTDSAKALYFFNERTGRVAHNQRASEPNLDIPEHYFVLHPQFLKVPWEEFEDNWGYWKNFILNLVAFVPFGLLFCVYFSSSRQLKRGLAVTIFMGMLLSLSIEMLQAFIPTRDSGMTDVITNTSGTALGAWLYVWLTRENPRGKAGNATAARDKSRGIFVS